MRRLGQGLVGNPLRSPVAGALVVLLGAGLLGLAGLGTGRGTQGVHAGQRRAESLVLRAADLPPGWQVDDAGSRPAGGLAAGATEARCLRQPDPTAGHLAGMWQTSFHRPGADAAFVGSYAGVADDEDRAAAVFRLVDGNGFLACAVAAFAAGFAGPAGDLVRTADPPEALPVPTGVDQARGRRVRFVARRAGTELQVWLDLVALRAGPTVTLVVVASTPDPLDAGLEGSLVSALAGRLRG